MAEEHSSTPESVPDSPQQIALHAAMDVGCGSDDEAGELLVAVYRRLSAALSPVRGRYDPNYP